jgi:amino acid transporter
VIIAIIYIFLKPVPAFRIMEGLLILQIIGILTTIVVLFVTGPVGFIHNFNSLAAKAGLESNYYQTVLNAGLQNGFVSSFSLSQTILFGVVMFALTFLYITAPSYIAGEFTRSTKTITRGTWAAYIISFILAILLILSFMYAIGINFLNASVGLASTGSSIWKFTSLFPGLTSFPIIAANGNIFLIALIVLGSLTWYPLWLILGIYIFSRYALALSVDRLLPKAVSNVTRKTGSPYVGIIILTVISMIIVPIYVEYESGFYVPVVYLWDVLPLIVVALSSISAVILGKHNKDYKIIIIGIITALLAIISFVLLSFLPSIGAAAGSIPSLVSIIILIAMIIGSIIWYLSLKWYFQKKYNIDIRNIFKALPPE